MTLETPKILETTKHRILKYLECRKISIAKFLKETGIKRGFLDSDKLHASVSDVFLAKIISKYNDINLTWLITGEGSMFVENTNLTDTVINNADKDYSTYTIELQKDKIASLEKEIIFLRSELVSYHSN